VPICRAAFGALEKLCCGALYSAMEKRSIAGAYSRRRRMRRWAREVVLAVVLTIAAAAFMTAAWLRGSVPGSPIETARKPPSN
jgi:hypothetical protein